MRAYVGYVAGLFYVSTKIKGLILCIGNHILSLSIYLFKKMWLQGLKYLGIRHIGTLQKLHKCHIAQILSTFHNESFDLTNWSTNDD